MTRYTNLGKKRTYVEAGFDHDESSTSHVPGRQASPSKSPSKSATSSAAPANEVASGSQTPGDPSAPQPRKHRRRHRSKKGKGLPPPVKKEKAAAAPTSEEDFGQGEGGEAGASERTSSGESRRKKIRGLRQPKDGSPRTTPPGPRLSELQFKLGSRSEALTRSARKGRNSPAQTNLGKGRGYHLLCVSREGSRCKGLPQSL
jgi:hypothetical protein